MARTFSLSLLYRQLRGAVPPFLVPPAKTEVLFSPLGLLRFRFSEVFFSFLFLGMLRSTLPPFFFFLAGPEGHLPRSPPPLRTRGIHQHSEIKHLPPFFLFPRTLELALFPLFFFPLWPLTITGRPGSALFFLSCLLGAKRGHFF